MKTTLKMIVSCVVLLSVIFAATSVGKELSVLERVNTIEDRELGELIRIAIENLPETKALERLHLKVRDSMLHKEYTKLNFELMAAEDKARPLAIRSVTEIYSQIKLLDKQIGQLKNKMERISKGEAVYTELTLALAELEAKQNTQFAKLRQMINIVPKYAFSHKPAKTLNGWLELDVIGDEVYVFKCLPPFKETDSIKSHPRYLRYLFCDTKFIKKMSKKEALAYIDNYIKDKNKYPFRIDVTKNEEGKKLAQELYDDIISNVKTKKLEVESVVYLHKNIDNELSQDIYVYDNRINCKLPEKAFSKTIGETKCIEKLSGLLNERRYLPLKLKLHFFNESGEELANKIEKSVLSKAKEMGMENIVEIKKQKKHYVYVYMDDEISVYFNSEDRKLRKNGMLYEKFIKEVMPEQLKRAADFPIKYTVWVEGKSNRDSRGFQKAMVNIMRSLIKEASLEARVTVE